MRVIAGRCRGLRLRAPDTHKVRPAADKVKGAIFNILGELSGVRCLDLFAGSGSVGIEALSRGADSCVFVEAERSVASYIEQNLEHCQLSGQSQILIQRVNKAIPWLDKKGQHFDLAFIDPPYDQDLLNPSLRLLAESSLLGPESLLVAEHSPRELPAEEKLEITDQRKYGQTFISFLKFKPKKP